MDKIYLDSNATMPLYPKVIEAMTAQLAYTGNASAVHSFGREARRDIEAARRKLAQILNCDTGKIIFNSGATEGNNTVLHAFQGQKIYISAIEHAAIYDVIPDAPRIPVTAQGIVDIDALHDMIATHGAPDLICVMLANNETGVIQPIAEISKIARACGAYIHVDAAQCLGRMPIDLSQMDIDFMTVSAHKMGGAQGVGALILAGCGTETCPISPVLIRGGGQEKNQRAGTENVAGIVGFGVAAEQALQELEQMDMRLKMRQDFEQSLRNIAPEIVIYGEDAPRLWNTIKFAVPNISMPASTWLMNFDLHGIALSSGSACSSGKVHAGHVMQAMGVDPIIGKSALRLSMGWHTTSKDLEQFLDIFEKIYQRLHKS
jgi:cysteine desulfurase